MLPLLAAISELSRSQNHRVSYLKDVGAHLVGTEKDTEILNGIGWLANDV